MRYAALCAVLLAACSGGGAPAPESPYELVEQRCGFTLYDDVLDEYVYHPPFTFYADPDLPVMVVLWNGTEVYGDDAERISVEWWPRSNYGNSCAISPPSEWDGWWWWDWVAQEAYFVPLADA